MLDYRYDYADTIKPGDTLPDVSRSPVARVFVFPGSHVRVTFRGTSFTRDFPYGGPEFGFACTRIFSP